MDQYDAFNDELHIYMEDHAEATKKVSQTRFGAVNLGAPVFRTKFVPSFEEIEQEHVDDVAFRNFRIKLQQYLPRYSDQVAQWFLDRKLPLRLQLKPDDRVSVRLLTTMPYGADVKFAWFRWSPNIDS